MRFDESQHYCVIRMTIDAEDRVGAAIELGNSFLYRAAEVAATFKRYFHSFGTIRLSGVLQPGDWSGNTPAGRQ